MCCYIELGLNRTSIDPHVFRTYFFVWTLRHFHLSRASEQQEKESQMIKSNDFQSAVAGNFFMKVYNKNYRMFLGFHVKINTYLWRKL
jgi:hypothetical protein